MRKYVWCRYKPTSVLSTIKYLIIYLFAFITFKKKFEGCEGILEYTTKYYTFFLLFRVTFLLHSMWIASTCAHQPKTDELS